MLDHRSLPEALQDDPPRPAPNHPAWALDEAARVERARRIELLRRLTLGTACLAAILGGLAIAGRLL